ncbi:MAG: hypothetical protein COA58_15025 [Bacteroidetes bacterium]|nr:MAG: hypothetical protein COA58_15025 [Bacteroidota bacterium]
MFTACGGDDETVTPDPKATYTADAKSILNASCNFSGCHNIGSANGSIGNYADAKAFAQGNELLKAINHEDGVTAMPQGTNKLSDAKIASLEKWVADGYLE